MTNSEAAGDSPELGRMSLAKRGRVTERRPARRPRPAAASSSGAWVRLMVLLFLGAFLTQLASLPAVYQSRIAANAGAALEVSAQASQGCRDRSEHGADQGCAAICTAPTLAAPSQTLSMDLVEGTAALLNRDTFLPGRAIAPDPHPPRSSQAA